MPPNPSVPPCCTGPGLHTYTLYFKELGGLAPEQEIAGTYVKTNTDIRAELYIETDRRLVT